MTDSKQITGLNAATLTPFQADGHVNIAGIGPMVDHLVESGVSGLYVCGSTGEGVSLSGEERRDVAQAFVEAADSRVSVIVQVGHNSLAEARSLAAHAQQIGADVVSATCPFYFKPDTVSCLVDSMAEVAAGAPELPFYYYNIPVMTGVDLNMVEFLQRGSDQIPNLAGLKYTHPMLNEFQRCSELDGGRFNILWGRDEMLLGALATGAHGAIGSTYNLAAPLYNRLIRAFADGDIATARRLQSQSVEMIATIARWPFLPAMKAILASLGLDHGGCRQPITPLPPLDIERLLKEIDRLRFYEPGASLPR